MPKKHKDSEEWRRKYVSVLRENVILRKIVRDRTNRLRLGLVKAALTGLLADHLDHADEIIGDETCAEAVARLAEQHTDAVIKRFKKI